MPNTSLDPPLTPIIDTVTGSVTEIGRRYLRTLGALVGALPPVDAHYLTSTSNPTLTGEVNLGALASGYLKLAVAIGIATPSTVASIPQADVTGLVAALAAMATLPIAEANVTNLVADLAAKAPLASPILTGVPLTPTAAPGTNTTQISSTAFVQAAMAALVASAPGTLDTLNELALALGSDPNFATTITGLLAAKAPLASPALTGVPTAPTAAVATNTTQLATTAFVIANAGGAAGSARCSAFHSAAQSLVTGTWTVLALDSEDFDSGTLHDPTTNNSRVVAPATGTYFVVCQTFHAASATGIRGLALQKNSAGVGFAGVLLNNTIATDAANGLFMGLSGVFQLTAGDYLELAGFQNNGANQTVGSATRRNASALQLVRLA